MNPKERVYAALRKEPVDRIPVFMWFHPDTVKRLAKLLDVPPQFIDEVMGNDVKQTWVNNNYSMEGIVHEKDGESHLDYWGIEWVREKGFNQIAKYPLADSDQKEVLSYQFPYRYTDELLLLMEPLERFGKKYFIGCDVSPCCFEMYYRLRGMENALLELASDSELTEEMFKRCADFAIELSKATIEHYRLDWLWTGDDIASQRQMLINPQTWRDLIKPQLRRIFDIAKAHGLYVAFHSCGAIRPIIADLIEIGLDVLNPIQCNCPGMDPLELKKEFGDNLAFMGGVDTQGVLPNGSVDDVRQATARLVEGMTVDGGGYILAASHTIPPETPNENIFAMYEEVGISKQAILDKAADMRRQLKSKRLL